MIVDNGSKVLSDVEVILPREVMETCRDLQQGGTSCFLSVNKSDCTTSQLIIHKLHDDSIKIRITGTFLTVVLTHCPCGCLQDEASSKMRTAGKIGLGFELGRSD